MNTTGFPSEIAIALNNLEFNNLFSFQLNITERSADDIVAIHNMLKGFSFGDEMIKLQISANSFDIITTRELTDPEKAIVNNLFGVSVQDSTLLFKNIEEKIKDGVLQSILKKEFEYALHATTGKRNLSRVNVVTKSNGTLTFSKDFTYDDTNTLIEVHVIDHMENVGVRKVLSYVTVDGKNNLDNIDYVIT